MGVRSVRPPAVFLDRDGVINRAIVRGGHPCPPEGVEDLEVLPGVGEALTRLKAAGYALVVVTNQPDVARRRKDRATVEAIHRHLASVLPLDEIRVCYHDDQDGCSCRKPKPGLLTRPPLYPLDRSVMVGDRWRDIEAARHAGCRAAILIDHGYDEGYTVEPDVRVGSLAEATDWILGGKETP
jgi:D-glycero-D-manno-heptose 1,7-bisphosphate phosphatase